MNRITFVSSLLLSPSSCIIATCCTMFSVTLK